MIQCSSFREEVQSVYLEPGSLQTNLLTVPDNSFVTRDIFIKGIIHNPPYTSEGVWRSPIFTNNK